MVGEMGNIDRGMAILEAISGGYDHLSPISQRTGINKDTCAVALRNLELLDIVSRMTPMFGSPKHPRYYISESLVAFYFDVISRNPAATACRDPDLALTSMSGSISTFLGKRFEILCRDYVRDHYPCRSVGRCWGSFLTLDGPDSSVEEGDIDLAALLDNGNGWTMNLFGECKFRRKVMGFTDLNKLTRRVDSLQVDSASLMLFSISGFDEDLVEYAEDNAIALVSIDELMENRPAPALRGG